MRASLIHSPFIGAALGGETKLFSLSPPVWFGLIWSCLVWFGFVLDSVNIGPIHSPFLGTGLPDELLGGQTKDN